MPHLPLVGLPIVKISRRWRRVSQDAKTICFGLLGKHFKADCLNLINIVNEP